MCTQNYSLMHTQSQSIHNMSLQYPTFSNPEQQVNPQTSLTAKENKKNGQDRQKIRNRQKKEKMTENIDEL